MIGVSKLIVSPFLPPPLQTHTHTNVNTHLLTWFPKLQRSQGSHTVEQIRALITPSQQEAHGWKLH